MLKNVSIIAKKYNIECQICILNFPICSSGECVCLINDKGQKKICDDGPVFKSEEIYGD